MSIIVPGEYNDTSGWTLGGQGLLLGRGFVDVFLPYGKGMIDGEFSFVF